MDKKEVIESLKVLENYTNFLTLTRKEHIQIIEHLTKIKEYINSKNDTTNKK